MRIYSYIVFLIVLGLLSLVSNFCNAYLMGFIIPLQLFAEMISPYKIQGWVTPFDLSNIGFIIGILHLLYSMIKGGPIALTKTTTKKIRVVRDGFIEEHVLRERTQIL